MSDYENWEGKLIRMQRLPDEDLELHKKRICKEELGIPEEDYDEESFADNSYERFVVLGDDIYQIEGEQVEDEDCFCKFREISDGIYEFHTRFYNGGTCLEEMLQDEFKI